MPAPNARFWFWNHHGHPVKLTLKPGQVLRWRKSWEHEEGWSTRCEEFEHEGGQVRWLTVDDGRDCDGRLTRTTEFFCALTGLKAGDEGLPAWEPGESRQRDYRAEAAGY